VAALPRSAGESNSSGDTILSEAGKDVLLVDSSSESSIPRLASNQLPPAIGVKDWSNEINYERLLQFPEVKDLIPKTIPMARSNQLIGERNYMMNKISIGGGLLPIKYSKTRSQEVLKPCGKVLVSILCYLAQSTTEIVKTQQTIDACILVCKARRKIFLGAWVADLTISVARTGKGSDVKAGITIPGVIYDYGRSEEFLEKLFTAINNTL